MFNYSSRFVGVELEIPENCDELDYEMSARGWQPHDDGSIPDDGCEYVSPKMQGAKIREDLAKFYKMCRSHEISTEHHTCGMHVHCDAGDLYTFVNSEPNKLRAREERIQEWGITVAALSRLFVGQGRNGTRFASGGFGIRASYECTPGALKRSRRVNYPTVAIREETFEFRIFPSTSSADYTMARVAFCQAATDWLFRKLPLSERTWKASLRKLTKVLDNYAALQDPTILVPMFKELGLCDDAQTVLVAIATKFMVGNRNVLPGIWQAEREAVMETAKQVRFLEDAIMGGMSLHQTPDALRQHIYENLPFFQASYVQPVEDDDSPEEPAESYYDGSYTGCNCTSCQEAREDRIEVDEIVPLVPTPRGYQVFLDENASVATLAAMFRR